jgi:hypothetical protein
MDGIEFAALDTLQYGLAGDPEKAHCLVHREETLHTFAALGVWSLVSDLAGRSAVRQRDRRERFHRFCPECREDTAHEGFDELGVGWYAQISHCQRCGRQGMRVWSLV